MDNTPTSANRNDEVIEVDGVATRPLAARQPITPKRDHAGHPSRKPNAGSTSSERKSPGCCDRFMGGLVDLVLTKDEDKLAYLKNYNCMPPPIFILLVSIIELAIFIYYSVIAETKQWMTLNDALLSSVLIYDPYKREQAWRFISYLLLHAGIEHIMGNILLQLVIGIPLEMVHKGLRVGTVYMSGVLAGSLASSMFDPFMYLVGASGGVYALIGGYFSNLVMNWSKMAMNGLHLVMVIILVLVDFAFSIYRRFVYYPEGGQQVSFVAHLAGGLAGITIGYVVFSNFNKKLSKDPKFWVCLLSYFGCCAVAVFWNLFLSPVGTI
uniref:rhomboid-related protein 2-like isoform X1 n=1 Tax=Styela clava TaxID=7725 RepID=UPI00193A0A7E|nr:rhomboid-related protein 2-like isoform X1 [Styela clava]